MWQKKLMMLLDPQISDCLTQEALSSFRIVIFLIHRYNHHIIKQFSRPKSKQRPLRCIIVLADWNTMITFSLSEPQYWTKKLIQLFLKIEDGNLSPMSFRFQNLLNYSFDFIQRACGLYVSQFKNIKMWRMMPEPELLEISALKYKRGTLCRLL